MDVKPAPKRTVADRLDEIEQELEDRPYSNAEIGALATQLLELIETAEEDHDADHED